MRRTACAIALFTCTASGALSAPRDAALEPPPAGGRTDAAAPSLPPPKPPAHWAFRAPQRPELPLEILAGEHGDWPRNPIDLFVLARLEAEGLDPAPEAEREVLIRRVTLDLTGLPPTPEEIDAFLADPSPRAYEAAADRLLASPRYGERWARGWLDLARYADTQGYEKDNRRTIWRYRDWVIAALGADMPFDRFTLEQLAGDLLPAPAPSQLLATAFHRNTMTNTEGGTDDEEFRTAAVVDRVNTTMEVWMGLTMGCAQCHEHKYDPITQREYYELFAFFNNTEDSDRPDEHPAVPFPTREEAEEIARLEGRIRELEAVLREAAPGDAAPAGGVAGGSGESPSSATGGARGEIAGGAGSGEGAGAAAFREELERLRKRRAAIEPPATPILRELPPEKSRETHVLIRGSFLERGEKVEPGVPAVFHPFPEGAPRNRLGLAQWLVHPRNPLVARVQVNRAWEQLFGRGLVETSEDFGTRGEPPSHPQLLDWLATEYVRLGWSTKALYRLIVTSATYRQCSRVSPELLARDPENRLLGHGPRFRLEAEAVRDQALAASGLLSSKMYGPSVMPPQPEGVWQVVYSGDQWVTSAGEDRYRRSLYTFWRRTSPHPAMVAFDAPSRELCVLRRVRTNTPLQALVTLNDPELVEAAQALARRIAAEGGGFEERAARGFRLVLARGPEPRELAVLRRLYESELEHARRDPEAAARLAGGMPAPAGVAPEELATWTVVANVLLNLSETLTRE